MPLETLRAGTVEWGYGRILSRHCFRQLLEKEAKICAQFHLSSTSDSVDACVVTGDQQTSLCTKPLFSTRDPERDKTFKILKLAEDDEINSDTDCPVCIDPYIAGDVVRTLPCK